MAAWISDIKTAKKLTMAKEVGVLENHHLGMYPGQRWPEIHQTKQLIGTPAGDITLHKVCPGWAIKPPDVRRLIEAGVEIVDGGNY